MDYDVTNVAQQDGRVWTVNVAGLRADYSGGFTLQLVVPPSFGPLIYLNAPADSSDAATNTYTFGRSRLVANDVLAEFGVNQVYALTFDYHLTNSNPGSVTQQVTLPLDLDTQQLVVQSLQPAPDNVAVDADGNYLANYTVPGMGSLNVHVAVDVRIWPKMYNLNQNAGHSALPPAVVAAYTRAQPYLAGQQRADSNRARALTAKTPSVAAQAQAIYAFTSSRIQYSSQRARVILSSLTNKDMRKGAVAALQPKSGVCMEYSDLFVTLARAVGIPARWRAGLAYQGKEDRNTPALQLGHAWSDFYAPGVGWVPVDATWGSAGDYFARADTNHITLSILGHSSTTPMYVTEDGVNVDIPFGHAGAALARRHGRARVGAQADRPAHAHAVGRAHGADRAGQHRTDHGLRRARQRHGSAPRAQRVADRRRPAAVCPAHVQRAARSWLAAARDHADDGHRAGERFRGGQAAGEGDG